MTEASGNINLKTVRAAAETGVNFISIGALTHSSKALDISLEFQPIIRRENKKPGYLHYDQELNGYACRFIHLLFYFGIFVCTPRITP